MLLKPGALREEMRSKASYLWLQPRFCRKAVTWGVFSPGARVSLHGSGGL